MRDAAGISSRDQVHLSSFSFPRVRSCGFDTGKEFLMGELRQVLRVRSPNPSPPPGFGSATKSRRTGMCIGERGALSELTVSVS
jgi:hypothetical protein